MKRGRVTARKCVKKRRRATCKVWKNEKLPVAKYLAKKQEKNLASVLESRKRAAALTRCKHEARADGLLLFSTGKFILNKVEGRFTLQTRPDLEGCS